MTFKLPENFRDKRFPWCSEGGVFRLGQINEFRPLKIIASRGLGWEHVSVSLDIKNITTKTPNWYEMCYVKSLFWDDDDIVVQYHLPAGKNINIHPGCLHLWRKEGYEFPMPEERMV